MENLRGSVLMVLAMAGFAVEDAFIKFLARDLPIGEILCLMGFIGAVTFAVISHLRGDDFLSRDILKPMVALRNFGEMTAAMGFVTAIALTPLSSASAIIQATSLTVTMGAALFMGEHVGRRRWTAICAGFFGVLLIIRPGLDGFESASLLAVLAVVGLAIRDLATRVAPITVSSIQLSGYAFASLIPAGLIVLSITGEVTLPSARNWGFLIAAQIFGMSAYVAIVAAMRLGDVSVITPFRYTRLIFALIIGIGIFGERPDMLTYMGAALIIASGLYTVLRERQLARRMARA
jgi:drug/metabolite transporter (DMT)-like permease